MPERIFFFADTLTAVEKDQMPFILPVMMDEIKAFAVLGGKAVCRLIAAAGRQRRQFFPVNMVFAAGGQLCQGVFGFLGTVAAETGIRDRSCPGIAEKILRPDG